MNRTGKNRIAETRGMSGGHLNRKLATVAISFKTLRESGLFEMARMALQKRQTAGAIASQLGFSDESAFSRAFMRWSGQTPSQFMRDQKH